MVVVSIFYISTGLFYKQLSANSPQEKRRKCCSDILTRMDAFAGKSFYSAALVGRRACKIIHMWAAKLAFFCHGFFLLCFLSISHLKSQLHIKGLEEDLWDVDKEGRGVVGKSQFKEILTSCLYELRNWEVG